MGMENEPVRTIGAVVAAIVAALSILIAFGAPVSEDQKQVILTQLPIVLIGGWAIVELVRSKVSPAWKVQQAPRVEVIRD